MTSVVVDPVTSTSSSRDTAEPQSAIGSRQSAFSRVRYPVLLLLITLFGGALRFTRLEQPPIWFDEAATFSRICGTYQQMLDVLQEAGFGPLHYHLYWWIKNGLPTWGRFEAVRVWPVIVGDGPFRQRTRLERGPDGQPVKRQLQPGPDGKVEVTNLLPQRPLIAGGHVRMTPFVMRLVPAICGTLTIPAMYWLARELTRRRGVALLAALLTATSAYLLNYSRDAKMYAELWLFATLNVAALLWWLRTRGGVAWWTWVVTGAAMMGLQMLGAIVLAIELIVVLTAPRANWRSLYLTPTIALSILWILVLPIEWFFIALGRIRNWDWTDFLSERGPVGRFFAWSHRAFKWPILYIFLAGVALILAGPIGYFAGFNTYTEKIKDSGWNGSGLQWIREYNGNRDGFELVRYGLSAFLTGWEWPRRDHEQANEINVRTLRLLKTGFCAILVAAVIGALPWPRRRLAHERADTPGLSGTPRSLGSSGAMITERSEASRSTAQPRRDRDRALVREPTVWESTAFDARAALWVVLWIALPLYVFYVVSIEDFTSPTSWLGNLRDVWRENLWPKIVLPLAGALCFFLAGRAWQARLVRSALFCVIVAAAFLVCWGLFAIYPTVDRWLLDKTDGAWARHDSVWIPRYLGVILPAILVALAVLFMRIPTRTLRAVAVLIFVATNLGQFGGRVFAGNEPPVDRMVQDVIDWRRSERDAGGDRSTKMVYDVSPSNVVAGLGPGTGVLLFGRGRSGMPTAKYYYAVYTDTPVVPEDIRPGFGGGRSSTIDSSFPSAPFLPLPTSIKMDVQRDPKLRRLVVWDNLQPGKQELTDKVLDALGPDWKRESIETFFGREHWTWRELATFRRRVYVKTAEDRPATPTTTQAAKPE